MPFDIPESAEFQFEVDLETFEVDSLVKLDLVMRKACLALFTSIVAGVPKGVGTPVDSGRARGGWMVGLDIIPMGESGRVGVGITREMREATVTAQTLTEESPKLATMSGESTVYIANNVPYIIPLEYGHSRLRAPQGMVRVAAAAFPYLIEKAAEEVAAETP